MSSKPQLALKWCNSVDAIGGAQVEFDLKGFSEASEEVFRQR